MGVWMKVVPQSDDMFLSQLWKTGAIPAGGD